MLILEKSCCKLAKKVNYTQPREGRLCPLIISRETPSITFVSIATGEYLQHWKRQILSARDFLHDFEGQKWILATDQIDEANDFALTNGFTNMSFSQIPSYGWPEATLFRYKIISGLKNEITTAFACYLDADMKFINEVSIHSFIKHIRPGEVTVQIHPGFYRAEGFRAIWFYLLNPKYLGKDLRTIVKYGGIGTWENSRISAAYLPRVKRKKYVCGGSWFSETKNLIKLTEVLSDRVEYDLNNNFIAKFHDESHLNWYVSEYPVNVIPPHFCVELSYPNLGFAEKFIEAVNKNSN